MPINENTEIAIKLGTEIMVNDRFIIKNEIPSKII